MFDDPGLALRWVAIIAATGAMIATCEMLANWRDFRDDGLYAWKVLRSRPDLTHDDIVARVADAVFDRPGIFVLLTLRLSALVALVAMASPLVHAGSLLVVVATTLALSYRNMYGGDGSDQMFALVFITLFLCSLSPASRILQEASLAFIAGQTALSYLVAGIAKLAGPVWRQGDAAFLVLNTESYGLRPVARTLHAIPTASRVLTWSVVAFECTFPLVFVMGPTWCWIFLAWGLGFHLFNAVVMGLNSFLWAFGAGYPAVLFCVYRVAAWLNP